MGEKQSKEQAFDHCFQILVFGDGQVGKTAFMEQIGKHKGTTLNEHKDQAIKHVSIADMKIKFYITDLSSWLARNGTKSADDKLRGIIAGAFIVVDVTNEESFNTINKHVAEVAKYGSGDFVEELPKMVLGNKADLTNSRKISKEEAYSWGKMLKSMKKGANIEYSEISALNGTNVDLVLQEMGEMVKNHVEDGLCLFGQQVAWFWQKIESKDEFL